MFVPADVFGILTANGMANAVFLLVKHDRRSTVCFISFASRCTHELSVFLAEVDSTGTREVRMYR